jgi:hypothetical protein
MAELAQTIRAVNERELDASEAALAACFPKPPQMSPEEQQLVIPFLRWADAQRVRALPAKPCSVAAYCQFQQDRGAPREEINAALSAISALHIAASVGDPVATPTVRMITGASTIAPPRSWRQDEKQMFTQLPVEIQRAVSRRERDREVQLRRMQNEVAELKRQRAAATSAADNEERTTNG